MCADALEDEPECLPLLLIRARAQIALRRDLEAQADLRDAIRVDPGCSAAYRLLGVLAARRDENESASVFFREALRLDPDDREAHDWLQITDASLRSPSPSPAVRSRVPAPDDDPMPRFARGTQPPGAPHDLEERPTQPLARGSERRGEVWQAPRPVARSHARTVPRASSPGLPRPTLTGHPEPILPAKPAPRAKPAPTTRTTRSAIPELPGFGEYLVSSGVLTLERLRAAQAYQRSMRVQLSTAIVTLGLATPQRIEWAAVAHQSQLAQQARERR